MIFRKMIIRVAVFYFRIESQQLDNLIAGNDHEIPDDVIKSVSPWIPPGPVKRAIVFLDSVCGDTVKAMKVGNGYTCECLW